MKSFNPLVEVCMEFRSVIWGAKGIFLSASWGVNVIVFNLSSRMFGNFSFSDLKCVQNLFFGELHVNGVFHSVSLFVNRIFPSASWLVTWIFLSVREVWIESSFSELMFEWNLPCLQWVKLWMESFLQWVEGVNRIFLSVCWGLNEILLSVS